MLKNNDDKKCSASACIGTWTDFTGSQSTANYVDKEPAADLCARQSRAVLKVSRIIFCRFAIIISDITLKALMPKNLHELFNFVVALP
jgi:hypothetical protein